MISRYPAPGIALLFFLSFYGFRAIAQPSLPDFTGNVDKGVIVLSWKCQYNGVKSITVLRSADGLTNYSVIGNVENLEKGMQVFVDGHPAPGKNCYKLGIIFTSGLKWSSNSYCRNIEKSELESSSKLPSNDSIQKLIVTQDIPENKRPGTANPAWQKNSTLNAGEDTGSSYEPMESARKYPPAKPADPPKVTVTFRDDTAHTNKNATAQSDIQPNGGKKIILSFEEPDETSSHLVRSRFLSTDAITGHIIMNLPDDVASHHYSIKFFDDKNNMITEVPRINVPKVIIDKRNFQRRGTYKFKLHRDGIELETGYISIIPNP